MKEIKAFKSLSAEINTLENEILNSDEACDLNDEIEELKERLTKLKSPLTEKRTELAKLQATILAASDGRTEIDGVIVKYTYKSEVNKSKLIEVLDNDLDTFMILASVTQKAVKDYAKDQPGMKKPLMGCVEVVSTTPSSLLINN